MPAQPLGGAMTFGAGSLAGVILAGGLATRMGGGDKGMREVAGKRLIDHVIDRLTPQVAGLAINANGDPARWAGYGLPVLADGIAGHPGPLAGILAGMGWAAEQGFDAVVSVAADTPFFPRDLVRGLCDAAGPQGVAIAASRDQAGMVRDQPTFGLWPVALRHDLRAALAGGMRKVVLWADAQAAGRAVFSGPADPFFNVNTPEDLALAEGIAGDLA